ncbi:MAG TPA: hypothetical protein VJ724_00175 [Tahibacter sp.]|nr:hypothetical protein [Tahibacter sp.]
MKRFAMLMLALGLAAGGRDALAQNRQTVCAGSQNVPAGWIKADDNWSGQTCGNPSSIFVLNTWDIVEYGNLPVNAELFVCNGPVPAGWANVGTASRLGMCGVTGGTQPNNNMMTIRHLSCAPPQSEQSCYPASIQLSSYSVTVPYGEQWGSVNVSWSAPGQPGACMWVSSPGGSVQLWACSGASGSATWPYVLAGSSNTFHLSPSSSSPQPVLTHNTVIGVAGNAPTIAASPMVVNVPAGQTFGSTTVSYNLSGSGHGAICVWVKNNDESSTPISCAVGNTGTVSWPWVPKGGTTTFWLNKSSTSPAEAYATVTVRGQ